MEPTVVVIKVKESSEERWYTDIVGSFVYVCKFSHAPFYFLSPLLWFWPQDVEQVKGVPVHEILVPSYQIGLT